MSHRSASQGNIQLDLLVPFWLNVSPPPRTRTERKVMFTDASRELNARSVVSSPSHLITSWRAVDIEWRRTLDAVDPDKLWHPFEFVRRKGCVLVGTIEGREELPNRLIAFSEAFRTCVIEIIRREIHYFDYGLGMLEYTFSVNFTCAADDHGSPTDQWGSLKEALSDCVARRELQALRRAAWGSVFRDLSVALVRSHRDMTRGRKVRWLDRLSNDNSTLKWRSDTTLLRLDRMFNLPPNTWLFSENGEEQSEETKDGLEARFCGNFGVIIYFENTNRSLSDNAIDGIRPFISAAIGGNEIKRKDRSQYHDFALSNYLTGVYHGPVDSVVVLAPGLSCKQRPAVINASRVVMRYLWLAYAAFAEAAGGLFERQVTSGLGAYTSKSGVLATMETDITFLQRAERLSRLLLSDFDVTTFYGSELEQDIYCGGFAKWGMIENVRAFKDAVEAVSKIESDLHREVASRKIRSANAMLAIVAALTIISGVTDFFSFSKWPLDESEFSKYGYQMPSPPIGNIGWRDYVSMIMLAGCLGFIVRIWWIYRGIRSHL